jgi:hypothetical protein
VIRCPACLQQVHVIDGKIEQHDRPTSVVYGYQNIGTNYVPCVKSGAKL